MISEKPWKLHAVGRLGLGVIGTLCMGILLNSFAASSFPKLSQESKDLVMAIVTLFVMAGILGWVWFFLWEENLSWKQAFGFASPRRGRALALGAVAAVAALPLTWGLQQLSLYGMKWLQLTPTAQEVVQQLQAPGTLTQRILIGIVAIVAAPFAEECVFRGVIYPAIKQAGYPKLAMVGTSILFGALHANALTFFSLTVLGVILILLYEATDNLLASIAAHSVFNALNFLALIFMDPMSRWLNLK